MAVNKRNLGNCNQPLQELALLKLPQCKASKSKCWCDVQLALHTRPENEQKNIC